MKKYFQIIGIISLACFSFIFTERTALMVKDSDDLMKTIKNKQEEFKIESVNAFIDDNTIIPGIKGKMVNNDKSYSNMKRLGMFNSNLLVYDYILPEITLTKTYDKYVIKGNPRKNMVSIIIKVNKNDKIDPILNAIGDNKVNFFIDGNWLQDNENMLAILNKYNIGNMSYNNDYSDSGFIWMNTVINRYSKQENKYCYQEEKNDEYLKACSLQKNYTILPSIIVLDNPLIEVKNKLQSGSIISLNANGKVVRELPLIINFIKSRGYNLVSLDDLLSEDI